LIAGAARVHPLADVARLLVNRREDRAGLVVEAELRARVADVADDFADGPLEIGAAARRDLARDDRKSRGHERFARDAGGGILRDDRVENAVGGLMGVFVGMP